MNKTLRRKQARDEHRRRANERKRQVARKPARPSARVIAPPAEVWLTPTPRKSIREMVSNALNAKGQAA